MVHAQNAAARPREFRPGTLNRIEELPVSRLRKRLDQLPPAAKARALGHLKNFHFTELDLDSLDVDDEGAIFYVDEFPVAPAAAAEAEPVTSLAPVPVNPFPAALNFHSKPGAPNVLFLNFAGENVSGTAWNASLGRTTIPAVAFSTDTDYSTFSDAEQAAIKRIWQRVAEDFAPFNIDVTTERPATFGAQTAHALITRNTDADGNANPSSTAGGVAYINMFGSGSFATYRPAWIYGNNFSGNEASIAEAASHEIGHNMGLSHDGLTSGATYYGGHGSGDVSWGPIMGTGYGRNVSQWSRGEYYLANNTQDDLATIAGKLAYRTDDHGDTPLAPTALLMTGTNIVSTTPETDSVNANPGNKGILERNTDVDIFSFTTGSGPIRLAVSPWLNISGTRGGNVDLLIELRDANGNLMATNNASSATTGLIQMTLADGTYYLSVRNAGVGDPFASTPSGYTAYGSIGQYFISGYVAPLSAGSANRLLTATANSPSWGIVTPASGSYPIGASVQVLATPAPYYQFVKWTNGASGTSNPLSLTISTNVSVTAVFGEIFTTNHPTPHSWLAAHGYTNNFEAASLTIGANGLPLWESYLAGLNPTVPNSGLRFSIQRSPANTSTILKWHPVSGQSHTVWWSTNVATNFTILPGAANLPSSVSSFTNPISAPNAFYRLEVRKL